MSTSSQYDPKKISPADLIKLLESPEVMQHLDVATDFRIETYLASRQHLKLPEPCP